MQRTPSLMTMSRRPSTYINESLHTDHEPSTYAEDSLQVDYEVEDPLLQRTPSLMTMSWRVQLHNVRLHDVIVT